MLAVFSTYAHCRLIIGRMEDSLRNQIFDMIIYEALL
jgi:hypothetical protein